MDSAKFNEVLQEVFAQVEGVLGVKAAEYATADRLHNFKQAAHLQGITPQRALAGMLAKHTVSVYDFIANDDVMTVEKWDEKIIDHINYLILLRALVVEETEKST